MRILAGVAGAHSIEDLDESDEEQEEEQDLDVDATLRLADVWPDAKQNTSIYAPALQLSKPLLKRSVNHAWLGVGFRFILHFRSAQDSG